MHVFKRTKLLKFESHFKELNYLAPLAFPCTDSQVNSEKRFKACIFRVNVLSDLIKERLNHISRPQVAPLVATYREEPGNFNAQYLFQFSKLRSNIVLTVKKAFCVAKQKLSSLVPTQTSFQIFILKKHLDLSYQRVIDLQ